MQTAKIKGDYMEYLKIWREQQSIIKTAQKLLSSDELHVWTLAGIDLKERNQRTTLAVNLITALAENRGISEIEETNRANASSAAMQKLKDAMGKASSI